MEQAAHIVQSIVNQPLGPLQQAQTRVAQLEARVAQADFYIAEALDNALDYHDMCAKLRTAHATLKEAMNGENDLQRVV